MNNILVVIDMQNDFVTGSLQNAYAKPIIRTIIERIEEAKRDGDFVIFTKDTHNSDYLYTKEGMKLPVKHCIKGTWGWEIVDELKPYAEYIYEKSTFGCVELAENLKQVHFDSITLVGTCTDICVLSNAVLLKSYFPDKEIIVEERNCAGSYQTLHLKAIRLMRDSLQITVK